MKRPSHIRRIATSQSQELAAVTADLREKNDTLDRSLNGRDRTTTPPGDIEDAREQLRQHNDRLEEHLKGGRTGEQS